MITGYSNYIVLLCLMTGILILRFDVKGYNMAKMHKEKKAARFIGWVNISLGIVVFVASWAYQNWFW